MCECGRGLIEVCGDALLGVLEVLDGIEFAGEEFRDIEDEEPKVDGRRGSQGVAFGDETLEGQFVKFVFEVLLVHHAVQLLVEGRGVCLSHALYAEAFASGKGGVAGLANLGDAAIGGHHDLHLLFAKLVTDEG